MPFFANLCGTFGLFLYARLGQFGVAKIKTNATAALRWRGHASGHAMPIYGYARVSTGGQELDIQLAQLRTAGCERLFCEKESGAKDERRELQRLLKTLRAGDTVIVAALDRLTRGGPFKTLSILNEITSRRATYKSLAEPWADTTHELGEVLAALVGYVARKTREDIIRRTAAGRERARANGVKFGRKPKLSPSEKQDARSRLAAGESQRSVARSFGVSYSTVSRLAPGPASN